MLRKIFHLDLDAFFCAVEEQRNPALAGQPFAVGGRPDERGVVASCSYAARRFGVHSAMPMARAIQLYPPLIIASPHYTSYEQASERVMSILANWTPLIEQISIDEAFLDLSDLPEPVEDLAHQLQAEIRGKLDLPCSLGVATNKLVAKIANDVGKSVHRGMQPPCAITVVPPGNEAAFMAPLPINALWGVGPKTAARMAELGVHTIGDLVLWEERDLVQIFGKIGFDLFQRARGLDDRPVTPSHEVKSISQETTFIRDINDRETLLHTLRQLTETVGLRLRQAGLGGTTIKIKLRWSDFTTLTRQTTLHQPTNLDDEIFDSARRLFEKTWQPRLLVRLIGVGVTGLGPAARQLELWNPQAEKGHRLQAAVDQLRERYGERAVKRGKG